MTSITPIYGIPYPDGSDLVSAAPTQLKSLATGMETALREVDQRATPAGSTPVTATTATALDTLTGVTGQTGYVTADTTENNGPYYWTGSGWKKYATADDIAATTRYIAPTRLAAGAVYWVEGGVVTLMINGANKPGTSWGSTTVGTLPSGLAPRYALVAAAVSTNNRGAATVNVSTAGVVTVNARGGAQTTDTVEALLTWPLKRS